MPCCACCAGGRHRQGGGTASGGQGQGSQCGGAAGAFPGALGAPGCSQQGQHGLSAPPLLPPLQHPPCLHISRPAGIKNQAVLVRLCPCAPPPSSSQAIPQRSWLAAQLISHFVGPYVEKEVTDTVKELCRCGWVCGWVGGVGTVWLCGRARARCVYACMHERVRCGLWPWR